MPRRSVDEAYLAVYRVLASGDRELYHKDGSLNVYKVAKRAGVTWETAKRAVDFFCRIGIGFSSDTSTVGSIEQTNAVMLLRLLQEFHRVERMAREAYENSMAALRLATPLQENGKRDIVVKELFKQIEEANVSNDIKDCLVIEGDTWSELKEKWGVA